MMRVAGLFAAGHDRVLTHTVPLHELHVNELFDTFRRQRLAFQPQQTFTHGRLTQGGMGGGHRCLRRSLGRFNEAHFLVGLDGTAFVKGFFLGFELVPQLLEALGKGEGEISRHQDPLDCLLL